MSSITSSHAATATANSSSLRAPHQGGVLDGVNPSHYDAKNPLILFIIQVSRVEVLMRCSTSPGPLDRYDISRTSVRRGSSCA
jgi:hypothetical protein